MFWQGRRESSNVEDRRGISGGHLAAGGGILGVIALVINMLLGGGGGDGATQLQLPVQSRELSGQEQAADEQRAGFVKVVLADTEDVWDKIFRQSGESY